jgi:hypothetical protein
VDGLVGLVREMADGLGDLLVQHLKLARLEVTADLRALGRRAIWLVVLAAVFLVGYLFTLLGVVCLFAGENAVALPMFIVGLLHFAGGAVGAFFFQGDTSGQKTHLFEGSAEELKRSLSSWKALRDGAAKPTSGPGDAHGQFR